jgi:hypothetical protein
LHLLVRLALHSFPARALLLINRLLVPFRSEPRADLEPHHRARKRAPCWQAPRLMRQPKSCLGEQTGTCNQMRTRDDRQRCVLNWTLASQALYVLHVPTRFDVMARGPVPKIKPCSSSERPDEVSIWQTLEQLVWRNPRPAFLGTSINMHTTFPLLRFPFPRSSFFLPLTLHHKQMPSQFTRKSALRASSCVEAQTATSSGSCLLRWSVSLSSSASIS